MESLKKRIANGDVEAFVELYDWLGDRLLRYLTGRLNPNDAQDVLQEVFIRLVRHHRRLSKSANMTAYVFLTARNEANRWIRRSRAGAQCIANSHELGEVADQQVNPSENREWVGQLLDALDPQTREIISLKIYSELTFKEVAKILKSPEATVATKYRRGIGKMKEAAERLKLQNQTSRTHPSKSTPSPLSNRD